MSKRPLARYCSAFVAAIDFELSRTHGFGCVTYTSNGAHDDMDFTHFLASRDALVRGFLATDWAAMSDFDALRARGIEIERGMFRATGGVNTHKGLLFLHLFLLWAWTHDVAWNALEESIRQFSQPLLRDYERHEMPQSTLRRTHHIADIRTYPLQGFHPLLMTLYKAITESLDDERLTLYLIATTDDTTTIKRSSVETLRALQRRAMRLFQAERRPTRFQKSPRANGAADATWDSPAALDATYIARRISSGGVADLFTTVRTLEWLRKDWT
ncbi:MAG: triphosphoribosyl-dephospho-CoA synthase [Peptoniphilaceae bacterium]|nr:triphosphoribosyl-dephospho-CoA synthase [Peptoniphilaceae bacterium]